jgi:hypothetical protein
MLDGIGVLPHAHLRGLQANITDKLRRPVTLLEFARGGAVVRTDSPLRSQTLPPGCSALQDIVGRTPCDRTDAEHAALVWGLRRENLEVGVLERLTSRNSSHEGTGQEGVAASVKHANGHPYLEYECEHLRRQQLLVPIFCEGQVLGALIVGCGFLEGGQLDTDAKNVVLQVEGRAAALLKQYPVTPQQADRLLRELRSEIEVGTGLTGTEEYESLVAQACREVAELEAILERQLRVVRDSYVREVMGRHLIELHRELPQALTTSGGEMIGHLWQVLVPHLDFLVRDFGNRFAVIFARRKPSEPDSQILEVVASVGSLPVGFPDEVGRVSFDLAVAPEHLGGRSMTSSAECPQLLNCVRGGTSALSQGTNLVRLFRMPFYPQGATAVWLGYGDETESDSAADPRTGYLSSAMMSLYLTVFAVYNCMLGASTERVLEATVRIFGHEIGQIASGFEWLRLKYLASPLEHSSRTKKESIDLNRNFRRYLKLLHFVSEDAKSLFRLPKPKKTVFQPYGDLLAMWSILYRLDAEHKGVRIRVHVPGRSADDYRYRPPMHADRELLERLVNNLLNNALKYSHMGTTIYLDCRKPTSRARDPHVLSVVDYGVQVDQSRDVFALYERGENVRQEGLGIGLHIAKGIAEAHGGSITVTCRKVSGFYVSLIKPYLDRHPESSALRTRVQNELLRLRATGEFDRIVASRGSSQQMFKPAELEIENWLSEPTWEVAFNVSIPSEEADHEDPHRGG